MKALSFLKCFGRRLQLQLLNVAPNAAPIAKRKVAQREVVALFLVLVCQDDNAFR